MVDVAAPLIGCLLCVLHCGILPVLLLSGAMAHSFLLILGFFMLESS
ncbi:unnamed protein product [Arabidopsis halleri]